MTATVIDITPCAGTEMPSEISLDRITLCGRGRIAVLRDALTDVPEVVDAIVGRGRIDLAVDDGQGVLPRLIELATLCDVRLTHIDLSTSDVGGSAS